MIAYDDLREEHDLITVPKPHSLLLKTLLKIKTGKLVRLAFGRDLQAFLVFSQHSAWVITVVNHRKCSGLFSLIFFVFCLKPSLETSPTVIIAVRDCHFAFNPSCHSVFL